MPNLNKTIEKTAKMMEKEAKAQLRSSASTKWNGFGILDTPEWRKVLFGENPPNAAKFLPDGYTKDSMILSIFVEKPRFAHWWENWVDYLTSRKNPEIGRLCCSGCILNYEPGPIGRHVLGRLGLSGRCDVSNAFLCPHKKEFDPKHLVFVGKISQMIERVLAYSAKQRFYDSQKTFKVDFGRNVVRCFRYPGDAHPFEDTIQEQLVPMSDIITLDGPGDYARALSDDKLFSKAFDQYCDFVENGSRYYGIRIPSKSDADKIRQTKDEVLPFVKELDVGFEVLDELYQNLLDFLRKEKADFDEHKKKAIDADPILFRDIIENDRNGACSDCGKFGNIKCMGCSVWICKEHWKNHAESDHVNVFSR